VIAEVISLSEYEAQVEKLLTEDERVAMEFFIAAAPEAHPLIAGTGGFRKARWALAGKGKSGGARLIYFYIVPPGQVFLAAIYAKSKQANLSPADRNVLAALATEIKKAVKLWQQNEPH
jgi:hypothetical protein